MVSYGVITRNPDDVSVPMFDRHFYEVRDVTGRETDPLGDAVNMVSCFGNNATAEADPDLVPVDAAGARATREQPYFDWDYICPTHPDYRLDLLALIESCTEIAPDLRLDDVGFPRQGYCRCDRCDQLFAESDHADRVAWRAAVITDFVREAAALVPGHLSLTVYPDPYPGHLRDRTGIDLPSLTPLVDEIVVPLYDTAYGTTYWLEIIANGFRDALACPLAIELYAVNNEIDALVHAAEVAADSADSVLFSYDASRARSAVERLRAES